MKTPPLVAIIGLFLLSGCGSNTSSAPTRTTSKTEAQAIAISSQSQAAPSPGFADWQSKDSLIALSYPTSLTPTRDFSGTYFTPAGWRMMFDGSPVGAGVGQVRFTAKSKSADEMPRIATDILQIGTSRNADVVADCLTRGLQGGSAVKEPNRIIGDVSFTVYSNGDAGMSHQLSSTDMRAMYQGTCIAIDRLTISVPASVNVTSHPKQSSATVEQELATVLASVTFH
ncbi:hypothetical protein GRI39_11895 [Altererythrobacter indicus]|uniref:Lipoprotein n=1 Tax=Altericroceibacterium indicum TaxID=374177 RepID=A0A845AI01_9SPHN|nr:hypothetical protein [Altericroceibacterium indicum]MXP26738.1 hypothetical protein [Altericroceibacterium indicum]